jgi:superfamily II RNA helicase
VLEWRGKRLNPFQVQAVEAIRSGHDVLVSAPTGAGKTLVAEYAIGDAVRARRRCIYTAPIKALSNQKYRDFRADPEFDVGLMTGDVTIHPTAQVLIMTTEILRNSIFENPEHLAEVEYVVFDEVHYMDDVERGSVWEESLIFAPPSVRFICLSATVPNVRELGEWLSEIRHRRTVVVASTKRPVPLSHHFYTARSGVFELEHLERVKKRELERGPPGGRHERGRRGGHGRTRGEAGRRARSGDPRALQMAPDLEPLLDQLQGRDLLPALVFAFSRKDCERLALRHAGRELLDPLEHDRMQGLLDELIEVFQLEDHELPTDLLAMARRGIAYHHAGMLPLHKELVERLFTSGLLKLLFTTETFALGINMPARTVVFHSLRKFDGTSFDYMATRDYLQMAGRAGRQGIDREGLVISLLSPRDLVEAPLKRLILGRSEPVESRFRLSFSSLLHLVERLGRGRVSEAWEKSFNQFQHRAGTPKEQEKNRREQARLLDAHLAFLEELGYVEGDALTPRGKVAKLINGHELELTHLLFGGALENLPAEALAVALVGLVFEERRRGEPTYVPAKAHGNVRKEIERELTHLRFRAAEHGLADRIKLPEWGLTRATMAWMGGAAFEELAELCEATPGDIVRHFRMTVQLTRQARRAIDPAWDLTDKLREVQEALNRDVVDARRQLELG